MSDTVVIGIDIPAALPAGGVCPLRQVRYDLPDGLRSHPGPQLAGVHPLWGVCGSLSDPGAAEAEDRCRTSGQNRSLQRCGALIFP